MDQPEDITAAKLKGHNCMIKFKDGETLFLTVPRLDNSETANTWFVDAEVFINGADPDEHAFPASGVAISQDSVKYIIKI